MTRSDLGVWGTEGADLWETGEAVWQELERSAGVRTELSGSGSIQPEIPAIAQGKVPILPLVPPVVVAAALLDDESSQEQSSQSSPSSPYSTTADFEKLKCLINLMKSDGLVQDVEKSFIKEVLAQSNLSQEQLQALQAGLKSTMPLPVVYGPFRESWRDRMALLMDLVALAQRDGEVHPAEKAYILEVSANVGLQKGEINLVFRQQQR